MNARTCTLMAVLLVFELHPSAPLAAQFRSPAPDDQHPDHAHFLHCSPGEGIEQSSLEPRRDRVRGALWGGGIGFIVGGLLGGLTVGSADSDDGFGGSLVEASATGEAVVLGALVGAVIGAVLGSTAFAPTGRADEEPSIDSGFSVSPIISHGATGLVVRFRR